MTKELIFFNVILPVAISILTVAIGTYLTIYARDKNINLNKINTWIRKILLFTFKYLLPVSAIFIISITAKLDKLYVLRISFLLSYIVFVSLYEIITNLIYSLEYRHKKTVNALEVMLACDQCICDHIKNNNPDFICTVKKPNQNHSS